MARLIRTFPLLVVLMLGASALMLGPLIRAVWQEDWFVARVFFYSAAFFTVISVMIGFACASRKARVTPLSQLLTLIMAYATLPLILAAPVFYAVPSLTYGQAYFEMLSGLTTTGATVFSDPGAIPDALHLWRGMVAWMGGFMILVAAVAVLEPLQLGGFEIEAAIAPGKAQSRQSLGGGAALHDRLIYHARLIAPPYVGLTLALAAGLALAGDGGLVAAVHAMSVLSTSGISPLADLSAARSGRFGEVLIFVFLLVALSHKSTSLRFRADLRITGLIGPEYAIAAVCLVGITSVLFLRHFLGAYEVSEEGNLVAAAKALWGTLFNVLSFLTTTGFSSQDSGAARDWSGLGTPGIILLGLTLMGGGIATTTGGIKLLRIYALYKHGAREMQRLVHPNSVGGAGITARRIRKEGAQIAWIFLMLFLIGVSVVLVALTVLGLSFEDALALSVAALTNTGPAAAVLNPDLGYGELDPSVHAVLGFAMIFGRVEALVFVSLFNPDYWRQ